LADIVDCGFVAALVILGFWLESLNGKHGWADELLAPFPLGLAGCVVLIVEEWA
jgi:hypothetical protein